MNLEDHIGDVLAKARRVAGISEEKAALLGGVSVATYKRLEEEGRWEGNEPEWEGLASVLELNARALRNVARGWLPNPVNLARWKGLRMFSTEGRGMMVHSYFIVDETSGVAALFDTGFDSTEALLILSSAGWDLKHLFITHTHSDHIAGMEAVRARFPGVRLHVNSESAPKSMRNDPEEIVELGPLKVMNRETPGHADDGVTYLISGWPGGAPLVAVVGDVIFAGSMGGMRQFGDLAKRKAREHIMSLPPETLICPGHGPLTTVGEELENNPFLAV